MEMLHVPSFQFLSFFVKDSHCQLTIVTPLVLVFIISNSATFEFVFYFFYKYGIFSLFDSYLFCFSFSRILVPSDFVGAIIGRKGATIRNVTTNTRAR